MCPIAFQGSDSDREVENALVVKLDYDKFDLIKELLRNRLKVVWCIRLDRAENEEDRSCLEVPPSSHMRPQLLSPRSLSVAQCAVLHMHFQIPPPPPNPPSQPRKPLCRFSATRAPLSWLPYNLERLGRGRRWGILLGAMFCLASGD